MARDWLRQPYPSPDVWNLPIGAGATYSTLGWTQANKIVESPIVVLMDPSPSTSPVTNVQNGQAPVGNAHTNCDGTGSVLGSCPIRTGSPATAANSLVVPPYSANVGFAGVLADGQTYVQSAGFARCAGTHGGLTYATIQGAWNAHMAAQYLPASLKALSASTVNGPAAGSTGASNTPINAGVIRIGELVPGQTVIPHALQLIAPNQLCYQNASQPLTYRWPATHSDSYYATGYTGTNPLMVMGSRLALKTTFNVNALQTTPGKILARTLMYYGGIVANTAGGDTAFRMCVEVSGLGLGTYSPISQSDPTLGGVGDVGQEFQTVWGYSLAQAANSGAPWQQDVQAIVAGLFIVGDVSASNAARQAADYANYQLAISNYNAGVPANYTGVYGGSVAVGNWGAQMAPDLGTGASAPAAPGNLAAGSPGTTSMVVSWNAPNNGGSAITDYHVQYRTTAGPGAWTDASDPGTALTLTVTGLSPSTSYDFQVRAVNAIGNGPYAAFVTASTTAAATVPGAPTGVAATAGDTTATVSWTAPANNGGASITGYKITGTPGGSLTVGNVLVGTVTGLTNGTPYTFTVHAINSVGNSVESAPSNSVTPNPPPAPPTQPTWVSETPGSASVALAWSVTNGGSAITSSVVTIHGGAQDGQTQTLQGAGTSLTVTGLTPGQGYTFTVQCINAYGTSLASAASPLVTPLGNPPVAPSGIAGTAGNAQAALSWTAPSYNGGAAITDYLVQWATDLATLQAGGGTVVDTASATTSYTLTGLSNGTTYYIGVAAVNNGGTSPYNLYAVVTPAPAAVTPSPPTWDTVNTQAGPNSVFWAWIAGSPGSSDITEYTLVVTIGGVPEAPINITIGSPIQTFYYYAAIPAGAVCTATITATNATGTSSPPTQSQAYVALPPLPNPTTYSPVPGTSPIPTVVEGPSGPSRGVVSAP